MPIWKYRGKKRQIPFNPELIARLLYDGHEVWPDEGAPEAQILREKTLINQNLKNLWGDKKMRVVDSDREVAVDETTEAPVFAPFKKVIPNPMIEQNMPAINPKEPPIGRQVKAPKSMVEMYAMGLSDPNKAKQKATNFNDPLETFQNSLLHKYAWGDITSGTVGV